MRPSEKSNRMSRHSRPVLMAACLASASCIFEPADLGTHEEFRSEFELVWTAIGETYPGFVCRGVDWDSLYTVYSPQVEGVGTQYDLVLLFAGMTAPLQEAGLVFHPPSGDPVVPWSPDIEPNFDEDVLWTYLDDAGFEWFQIDVWGGCMLDSVPYVLILNWSSIMSPIELDEFMEEHPDAPGMIIDIRPNTGSGSGTRLGEVARRFNDELRVGYFRVGRSGPEPGDLSALIPRIIPKRAYFFDRPLAVLTGETNGHTSEEFACMASQLPFAALIGDTTMRQAGHAGYLGLPGGWYFTLPDTAILRADTAWVQVDGVPPDIYVQATEDDFAAGIDPVLEYAVEWAAGR